MLPRASHAEKHAIRSMTIATGRSTKTASDGVGRPRWWGQSEKQMRVGTLICLLMLATGCKGASSSPPERTELDAYCAIAGRTDLSTWIGDTATLCEHTTDTETCRGVRVE